MVTVYFKVQRVDLPAIRQTGLGPLTDMAAKTKGVMPLDQTSAAIVNIIFNDGASKLGLPFSRTGLFRFSPSFAAPASDTEFAVLTSEINSEKVLVLPHSLISVAQLATLHLLRTINEIYEARAVGALHPNGSPNLSAAESHRTDFSELVSDPARLKSAWAAE